MVDITARTRLKLLAGFAATLLPGCGSSGGSLPASIPVPVPVPPPPPPAPTPPVSGLLRGTYAPNFLIGAAIGALQIQTGSDDANILANQFSSITAENAMKPQAIAPTEGNYNFSEADALLTFAEANNIQLRGHTLLWHQQTPDYFFAGTRADIRARLEKYITDVVTHFKGKVYAWDVVNEVTSDGDGGTAPYRDNNWYQAVGPEYIDWAFQAARAADPDVKLFINDYNTESPDKQARFLQIIEDLLARNIPLDGVGHQAHVSTTVNPDDILGAIDAVDNLFAGLENHITELDISVYTDPGSCYGSPPTNCAADYGANIPDSVLRTQAQLYRDIFNGLVARPSVTSATFWGLTDDQTWLNTFPISRTNYPLLFDANREPKPAFHAITDPTFVI
ncbi:MAG: endo-1,4-beta-xylanase [Robiginitomaculum sp.]|nr:MAG: endo-1,4-beta-xylanase [Robiginitomaculum sp.]